MITEEEERLFNEGLARYQAVKKTIWQVTGDTLMGNEKKPGRRVYLDNMATTPVLPEVLEAMLPYFREVYGNPQSIHSWGDEAREAIEKAREQVAALIGGDAEEIIFTSSGSEANNLALKGLAQGPDGKGEAHNYLGSRAFFGAPCCQNFGEGWL